MSVRRHRGHNCRLNESRTGVRYDTCYRLLANRRDRVDVDIDMPGLDKGRALPRGSHPPANSAGGKKNAPRVSIPGGRAHQQTLPRGGAPRALPPQQGRVSVDVTAMKPGRPSTPQPPSHMEARLAK